jgi:tripartite-type tricarboxylate transporter receptor subunit TctC
MRKRVFLCAAIAVCAAAHVHAQAPAPADARAYPSRPIRFIVGFVPGGGTDMLARLLARKLSDSMGQQVIVDNRAGSAGIVAAMITVRAPADGHTLLAGTISTLATNVSMHAKLPYDPVRDFAPIALATMGPYLLVAHPATPAQSMKELLAYAKSVPGKLNFGSAGSGSGVHLAQEMLKSMAGIDMVHVPYKGAADQMTSLIAGETQLSLIQVQVVLPQVRAGRLRALAISGAQRLSIVSDLPTIAEAGVPGYEATSWQGVVAPAGVARAVVQRVNAELNKALHAPDTLERFAAEGLTAGGGTPEAFATHIRHEIAKWAKVVKTSGAKAD